MKALLNLKQTLRLAVCLSLLLGGCSSANIEEVKEAAPERWKELVRWKPTSNLRGNFSVSHSPSQ